MKVKNIIVTIIATILGLAFVGGVWFLISKLNIEEIKIKEKLERNVGEELPILQDYLEQEEKTEGSIEYYIGKERIELSSLNKREQYRVKLIINRKEYTSVLEVKDSEAPILTLKEITTSGTYEPSMFVESCTDNSKAECIYSFKEETMTSYSQVGSYEIEIVAKDPSGNEVSAKTTLNITRAPNQNKNTNNTSNSDLKNDNQKFQEETEEIIPPKIVYKRPDNEEKEEPKENIILSEEDINDSENFIKKLNEYRTQNEISNNWDEKIVAIALLRAIETVENKALIDLKTWFQLAEVSMTNAKEINIKANSLEEAYQKVTMEHNTDLKDPKYQNIGAAKYSQNGQKVWVIILCY